MMASLRGKYFERWIPGYLRHLLHRVGAPRVDGPRHLLFALCDHFEPLWGQADRATGEARVAAWVDGYPRLAGRFADADGYHPRHSFFFPGEQYDPAYLEPLACLARAGLGEVEYHLHHADDTAATLRPRILQHLHAFARHGHLARDRDGRLRYAFIHGNWALANGRRDGRYCGVDDELPLLFETGCYADLTFPSVPDDSQPNIVNQIYWPSGNLARSGAYRTGTRARVGEAMRDRILMIEGPLALARRPGRPAGRIENGALTATDPPTLARARTWAAQSIQIEGRPEWVFVKVHTHGAPELQAAALLGDGGNALHEALTGSFNDGRSWCLHYVTAREMFNIAIAAMDGASGNPHAHRNHVLAPPPAAQQAA
jgi:hypothetical protein